MVHDFVREHGHRNAHVSVIFGLHWCAQVKIFEIAHHALGIGHVDDAVEEDLDCGQISSFGADVASVVNVIVAHSPMDAVWAFFFGAISAHHTEIGGFGAGWELMDSNELHGWFK